MKPNDPNTPREDDQLFDLLVDGQLDEPRRRELLSGLDDQPGGWRKCALAFLEAQSWREAMDAFTRPQAAPREPVAEVKKTASPPPRRRRRDYLTTALGIAASVLLGIGLHRLSYEMRTAPGPGLNTASLVDGGGEIPNLVPLGSQPQVVKQLPAAGQNVHLVGMSGRGTDGKRHTFGLPAVARDQFDEQTLRNMPSAIPDEVTRSLRQAGHDVRSSRELIPFQLKDGRRLIVPVDNLDVNYADYPTYQ
jgi:hypothetical protein